MSESYELLAEVMASRASFYRMLSRLFFEPLKADDIDMLESMDFVAQAKELGGEGKLAQGLNDMGRGLRRRHTGTRTLLATDFTMCFDGIRADEGKVAVPYASVFLSDKGLLYQKPRSEVYELLLSQGLRLKKGVDLPEDHLSFEFEYLAILAERAQEAFKADDSASAQQALQDSIEFLDNHVKTWLPMFEQRALALLETRFYQGVVKAASGYVELDEETVSQALEVCREAA
ncbi:molecular chaperone [uncultured Slackia sp.]|uniref:TorD/DmsD family molecular chaperone n=1 Tax=uncultured Slackia sp. TaxID=665903 RepID=UPI002675E0A0|nr:molecular chaperone TorD family protein [uncultured Slackia sp.]